MKPMKKYGGTICTYKDNFDYSIYNYEYSQYAIEAYEEVVTDELYKRNRCRVFRYEPGMTYRELLRQFHEACKGSLLKKYKQITLRKYYIADNISGASVCGRPLKTFIREAINDK